MADTGTKAAAVLNEDDKRVIKALKAKIHFPADIASFVTNNSDGDIEMTGPDAYAILQGLLGKGIVRSYLNEREKRVWVLKDEAEEPVPTPQPDGVGRDHTRSVHPSAEGSPDFLNASIEQIEGWVLGAIDAEFRTYGGIKRYVGAPKAFDLSDVIDGLATNYILRKEVGEVTCFFRFETKPLSFKLVGDGRVEAEFDPDFQLSEHELEVRAKAGYPLTPVDEAALETEPVEIGADVLETVESLAAQGNDFPAIAAAVELGVVELSAAMRKFPSLRDAYERGVRSHGATIKTDPPQLHQTQPQTTEPDLDDEDPDEDSPETLANEEAAEEELDEAASTSEDELVLIEQLAEEHGSQNAVAEAIGLANSSSLAYRFKKQPGLRDAYARGKAKYLEAHSDEAPATGPVGPGRVLVTEERLEELSHKHKGNQEEIALELGYTGKNTAVSLRSRMRKDEKLRAAYERGLATAQLEDPTVAGSRKREGIPKIAYTAAEVEEFAAEHGSQRATAEALGYAGPAGLREVLANRPEYKEAFERGQKRWEELKGKKVPASPTPVVPKALEKSSIVMEIEEPRPVVESGNGHAKAVDGVQGSVINFAGGSIVIGLNVNLLAAPRDDRDALNTFIDAAQALGAKRLDGGGVEDGSDAV